MGITLREIIFDIGGGVMGRGEFKAAQTGGPSGGCIPASMLDLQIDFEHLAEVGSIMGSGGLVVMDDRTCMVDLARYFLTFTQSESCGKCTPCRLGTKAMLEILEKICTGRGKDGDIELLTELAESIKMGSLCGLGQTAPNPVLTTIQYFKEEYKEHIHDMKCRAGICKDLVSFEIEPETCKGCGACLRACPVEAIAGEKKQPHKIDQEVCIRCGSCVDTCKFGSILVA
jgi:NADP-reducing hydrogenase subunit HndC